MITSCPLCGKNERMNSMGKFCGMCGYKLEEDWTLCPKCGHKVTKVEPLKEEKSAEDTPTQEVEKSAEDTPIQEAETPKADIVIEEKETESPEAVANNKKKPFVKILSLVLAILLLLGGGGFFLLRFIRVATAIIPESNYVIKNEYGEFFLTSGGLINLDCPEDGLVEVTCEGEEIGPIIFDYYWVAEDVIYSIVYDKDGFVIYKSQFESETEIEAEVWMDSEELRSEIDVVEQARKYLPIWDLQYADGKLYLRKLTDCDKYRRDMFDGRLYSINTETKEIECLDRDAQISSYIVDKNDIYFTGKCGDESGVFRMNPDGSKRKLIYEVSEEEIYRTETADEIYYESQSANNGISTTFELVEKTRTVACRYSDLHCLAYCNGRLYISIQATDALRIISINKNGKDEKTVIDDKSIGFRIDSKRNVAYYSKYTEDNEIFEVYELSLSSLKSKKLFEAEDVLLNYFEYEDNKLYFSFADVMGTGNCGIIYDLRKKEATGIYYDSDDKEYYTDDVDDFIEIE